MEFISVCVVCGLDNNSSQGLDDCHLSSFLCSSFYTDTAHCRKLFTRSCLMIPCVDISIKERLVRKALPWLHIRALNHSNEWINTSISVNLDLLSERWTHSTFSPWLVAQGKLVLYSMESQNIWIVFSGKWLSVIICLQSKKWSVNYLIDYHTLIIAESCFCFFVFW